MSDDLLSFLQKGGSAESICERCLQLKDESNLNIFSKPGLPWVAHPYSLEVSSSSTSFKLTFFVSIFILKPELFSIEKDGEVVPDR
jgi:hypothetical protein